MANVVPIAPVQGQPTNLRSSRSSTSLRQSSCQRDPNSCPSIFCVILTGLCVLRVVVPLHFVVFVLSSLAVVLTLSFVLVLALALAFVVLAFALARAGLAFAFVVCARPSTCLVVLQVFGFLSTVSRHMTVNSTQ